MVLATLLVIAPGCASEADDATDTSSETEDLTNCSAASTSIYLEVKSARAGLAIYAGPNDATPIGKLEAKTAVARKLAREIDGKFMTFVDVRTGPLKNRVGWVESEALRVRTPDTAEHACASGVDPARNASAAELAQSTDDALPLTIMKSTVMCAVGAGEGVMEAGESFLQGLVGLVRGGALLAKEIALRDADIILMMLGSKEARERLQIAGMNDAQKVQALVAMLAHALPAVHSYLQEQYLYYHTLDTPHKTRYLCKLLASTATNVILTFPSLASGLTRPIIAKLESVNRAVARVAALPSRIGDSPFVTLRPTAPGLTPRQVKLLENGETLWTEMVNAKGATKKKQLVREFVDINNPISDDLGKAGGGNCGFAAVTSLFALGSGHLACALPYYGKAPTYGDLTAAMQESKTLVSSTSWTQSLDDIRKAATELKEGQLALLYQTGFRGERGTSGAHAMVLTKIDNELVVVNNQGWNEGAKAGTYLQSLDEWDATWRARFPDEVDTQLVVTSTQIPFTPP